MLDAVRAVTGPFGAHFTFESTGLTDCMAQAVSAARPGGIAVLLGMAPGPCARALDNIADIILQEKVITGSPMGSGYSARDFAVLVRDCLEGPSSSTSSSPGVVLWARSTRPPPT
ncbi:zinc-binding dehydrogenase [Streptomyces sp. DSM 15324]|uniref:zinc-binding dehydrogenase n=1 Tax=Streptomyces sp. DSM 15324 TaxID=1739111 RepID=UPI000749172F|nr:zinc-binding dehydrogenase [Streptomyces sp. DSM 15324]KUO09510.1 hypothetical protein AQJ58_24415 [Streptomyces sp. DSM 15324]